MTEWRIGGSLFERIVDAAVLAPSRTSPRGLLHSIRQNLQNILNTRTGSCYGSPELGLVDFNDDTLSSSNFRDEIGKGIRTCILRYEPRVAEVEVVSGTPNAHSPLALRFHIVAQVKMDETADVLEFDLLLDSQQHCRME